MNTRSAKSPSAQESHVMNQHGFTLIELLTVILVVGVLASILIPLIGAARERANLAASISQLRQIGGALSLYAADNGGRFPFVTDNTRYSSSDPSNTATYWQDELLKFVGNWSVQARADWFHDPAGLPISMSDNWTHGAYSGHMAVMGFPDADPQDQYGYKNRSPLEIVSPSDQILVFTGTQTIDNEGASAYGGWAPWPWMTNPAAKIPVSENPESEFGGISYRLNDEAGCLMVDGSVRTIKKGEITYRNWNPRL